MGRIEPNHYVPEGRPELDSPLHTPTSTERRGGVSSGKALRHQYEGHLG